MKASWKQRIEVGSGRAVHSESKERTNKRLSVLTNRRMPNGTYGGVRGR